MLGIFFALCLFSISLTELIVFCCKLWPTMIACNWNVGFICPMLRSKWEYVRGYYELSFTVRVTIDVNTSTFVS